MRMNFDTERCPDDIIELCLGWYLIRKDEWNPDYITDGVELNGDCVELKEKDGLFDYKTVAGSLLISSSVEIKEWKLKCLARRERFYFQIGLLPNKDEIITSVDGFDDYGYCWDILGGGIKCNGEKNGKMKIDVRANDIISMKYVAVSCDNTIHGELYFAINDADFKKAVINIPIDKEEIYVFAVSFIFCGETVQLLQ